MRVHVMLGQVKPGTESAFRLAIVRRGLVTVR
jgi:hypothetical protein